MAVEITQRPFTAEEYERMAEAGILDGAMVQISPIGSRHAAYIDRLQTFLERRIGDDTIIRVQSPIRLDDYTEPQPDSAVLRLRADFSAAAHPTPADVLPMIEVAQTSLDYDRAVKLPRYAASSILEVWLVDLAHDAVSLCRQPRTDFYADVQQAQRGTAWHTGSSHNCCCA